MKNTVSLKCKNCDAAMTVSEDQTIVTCPFCGSAELILDSDAVKIEKIKSRTYKDVESKRLEYEKEMERKQDEKEQIRSFKKSFLSKLLVVFTFICTIVLVVSVKNVKSVLDFFKHLPMILISLAQIFFLAGAWLTGFKAIKRRWSYRIMAFIGFILFIPLIAVKPDSTSVSNINRNQYYDITWPDSEIVGLLPEPESTVGELLWDKTDSFAVYIAEISRTQYDDYVQACRDKDFTVDYSRGDSYYYAENSDGYDLSLKYDEDDHTMYISIREPMDEDTE